MPDHRARNQVPALAEAWLDIRFPPEDGDLNVKSAEEISAYLASFCEPGVTAVVHLAGPLDHADRLRPEIRAPQRAAANQGYNADFLRRHGPADGRFYYQHGTAAVIFGIGGDGLHGSSSLLHHRRSPGHRPHRCGRPRARQRACRAQLHLPRTIVLKARDRPYRQHQERDCPSSARSSPTASR